MTPVSVTVYRCDLCKTVYDREDVAMACEAQGLPARIAEVGEVLRLPTSKKGRVTVRALAVRNHLYDYKSTRNQSYPFPHAYYALVWVGGLYAHWAIGTVHATGGFWHWQNLGREGIPADFSPVVDKEAGSSRVDQE